MNQSHRSELNRRPRAINDARRAALALRSIDADFGQDGHEPPEEAANSANETLRNANASRLSGMAAWLTEGSPWWDTCSCGHSRWAHTEGPCDRLSEPARSKNVCRCRSFQLASVAADPLLAQPARMGGGE